MTYIYAIFKHTATIVKGKKPEWLIILGTITKGGSGVTPPEK